MIGAKKHLYATDSNERKIVMFWLAVISVVLCYLVHFFLENRKISLSYWISAPSAVGLYGLLYAVFNEWVWEWRWLHKINLVKVPVVSGKWNGILKSSFDDCKSEKQITISIYQTWTELLIVLETESSSSYSLTASVQTSNPHCTTITYEFINSPSNTALETMQMHNGTTTLELKENSNSMVGYYYSGRGRKNIGDIKVTRIQ